ncbi:hypothetical protein BTA51_02995 [Hahella sp. CCB-MM4]|uniref:ACT domain-containing protein n=1 Tax=Hahella sp. (strain CCB-MM4) TaxID=1926491 RepID=UPI000B9B7312|nr:ACT domain-containing protein [Hahella sp. CCB-MM4]OZG75365.1 hypothetical protein BTA51_02995 [Hahella sp. CCB-MM4]
MNTPAEIHQLQCQFSTQTGAIERLLRMIRVRGYRVQDLQLEMQGEFYQASFSVAGHRSINNLISQIDKLIEVTAIRHVAPQALDKCA